MDPCLMTTDTVDVPCLVQDSEQEPLQYGLPAPVAAGERHSDYLQVFSQRDSHIVSDTSQSTEAGESPWSCIQSCSLHLRVTQPRAQHSLITSSLSSRETLVRYLLP